MLLSEGVLCAVHDQLEAVFSDPRDALHGSCRKTFVNRCASQKLVGRHLARAPNIAERSDRKLI